MENHTKHCPGCAVLQQPNATLVVEGPAAFTSNLADVSRQSGLAESGQVFNCRECGQFWLITYDRHLEQYNFDSLPRHLIDELKTASLARLIQRMEIEKAPAAGLVCRILQQRFRDIHPADISACWKKLLAGVVRQANDRSVVLLLMGLLSSLLAALQHHLAKSTGNVPISAEKIMPVPVPDHKAFDSLIRRLSASSGSDRQTLERMQEYKKRLSLLQGRFPGSGELEFHLAVPHVSERGDGPDKLIPKIEMTRILVSVAAILIFETGVVVAAIFLVESGGSFFALLSAGAAGLVWGWASTPVSGRKTKILLPVIWLALFLPFVFSHYLNYDPTLFFETVSYTGRSGFTVTPDELVKRVNKAYDRGLTSPFWASLVNRAEVGYVYKQSKTYGMPRSHRKGWEIWFGWATQLFVSPFFGIVVFMIWRRTQKRF